MRWPLAGLTAFVAETWAMRRASAAAEDAAQSEKFRRRRDERWIVSVVLVGGRTVREMVRAQPVGYLPRMGETIWSDGRTVARARAEEIARCGLWTSETGVEVPVLVPPAAIHRVFVVGPDLVQMSPPRPPADTDPGMVLRG